MLPPFTISARLALWYGLTILVLLSLFAAFCYTSFHLTLHRDFDRHLTHEQRVLLPYVTAGPEGPRFEGLEELTSVAHTTDGAYGTYVRLLSPSGDALYRSPNFAAHTALPVALPERTEEGTVSRTWEGAPLRSRYVPLLSGGGLAGWLEVSGFEWNLHQELHRLGWILTGGVLGSVLFAILGGFLLARRALRPVAALTAAAGTMGARDLSARLPTEFGPRDELTELAETFNGLLDRLEASVARERRFTANAAHELMNPLATLRSEAEVALRRARDPERYREVLRDVLADAERLSATVEGLLRLARAERLASADAPATDLAALLGERVEGARAEAERVEVVLEVDAAGPAWVRADAAAMAEVVDNLVGNALKYTPSGGRVRARVRATDGTVRLAVADTGAGFAPEEADHLFDRFYRSEAPEVRAQPGSGLGLAIVRAVVGAYGGTVSARSEGPGRGSTFEVQMPRADDGGRRSNLSGF